jgi:hypothetical protein
MPSTPRDLQDQKALVTGSPRASYVTGAIFAADGGRTAI